MAMYYLFYRMQRPRIQVNQAALSGDGSFIDIRYWLSRPDKAECKLPIYLIDEITGERFNLMTLTKCGVIRTKHSKYQPLGILLFYNRNNALKCGARVSLFFGSLNATHIDIT